MTPVPQSMNQKLSSHNNRGGGPRYANRGVGHHLKSQSKSSVGIGGSHNDLAFVSPIASDRDRLTNMGTTMDNDS